MRMQIKNPIAELSVVCVKSNSESSLKTGGCGAVFRGLGRGKIGEIRVENGKFESVISNAVSFNYNCKHLKLSKVRNKCKKYFVRMEKVRIFAPTVSTTLPT